MVEHNPAGGQRLVQASVLGTVLSYAESRMRPAGMTLTALLICAFSSAVLRADLDLTLTAGQASF